MRRNTSSPRNERIPSAVLGFVLPARGLEKNHTKEPAGRQPFLHLFSSVLRVPIQVFPVCLFLLRFPHGIRKNRPAPLPHLFIGFPPSRMGFLPAEGFPRGDLSTVTAMGRNGSLPGQERRVDKIDISLAFGLCSVGIQCTERQKFFPSQQAIDGNTLFSKERNMQKIREGRGPPVLPGDACPNHRNRGKKANHEKGMVPWRYSPIP